MTDILKTLLSNSAALAVLLVVVGLLVLAVVTFYTVAFVQGRSVSFWPPSIGPKPSVQQASQERPREAQAVQSDSARSKDCQLALAVRVGTSLVTSSGRRVQIESNSYTGVRATLMRAKDDSEKQLMVKLFWRGLNPSSNAWVEFSREYSATSVLHHRNIVETIDRGLWNGYPFLVFEFFPGGTLYDFIRSRDRISGAEILSIAEQVASGIDYAHTQGRVHRDLTPSNVLLESDARGRVAISDLGIARILGALDSHITSEGPVFEGTPAYVAPEVFSSKEVTPLMDIYGFGVILFEMIAGRCPFPDVESVYELFELKLHQPVPRLMSYRRVPNVLDNRLAETLHIDPQRRPQTARAVLSGVEESLLGLN